MSDLGRPTEARGAIEFWLKHDHSDWATNPNSYAFPKFLFPCGSVVSVKRPDGTITFEVDGPLGTGFYFTHPVPRCKDGRLMVALSWEAGSIRLYLNGDLVQTETPPPWAL